MVYPILITIFIFVIANYSAIYDQIYTLLILVLEKVLSISSPNPVQLETEKTLCGG